MNIKILDSWLRDYLHTDAKPKEIANALSLTSVGIEHIEKWKDDYLYDIEITTNRPDLASVVGIAREAAAVLPQFGHQATFKAPLLSQPPKTGDKPLITIKNDPKLVNRLCAVVMEVECKTSPQLIQNRLEASDIRSLNNIVDVTNYVMRTIGYPTHVFDFDRLQTSTLTIKESQKGDVITTLDDKDHELPGGDIIAVDDSGRIVDLLGIMGLKNSVVTPETKRILLFINNDEPLHIRKTSMALGIRTEAAQLNEKELDPELVMEALLYGIGIYKDIAGGKVIGPIIDIYSQKPKTISVTVTGEHINRILGVTIPLKQAAQILTKLGFITSVQHDTITAQVPSFRLNDIAIPEDLIEEIARVYGYQNIPNLLPPFSSDAATRISEEPFYWESLVKHALKNWGFTEVYTYPMVSETMYEGSLSEAVKLKNPLGEEFTYMRRNLVPSILQIVETNKKTKTMRLFEIGNVYEKQPGKLPLQTQHLTIVIKEKHASFFVLKGVLEELAAQIGIHLLTFRQLGKSGLETEILIGKQTLGTIEILDEDLLNLEIDFEVFIAHATNHKTFTPLQKYPPIIEDISLIIDEMIPTGDITKTINDVSPLIVSVTLLDKYEASRTFHILYQHQDRNVTGKEVGEIREKVLKKLHETHNARLKS